MQTALIPTAPIGLACESAKQLAFSRMLKHEFVDGSYRRQKTYFSDGTTVLANLDSGEYSISKK